MTIVISGRPYPGDLADISRGGLLVRSPVPIELSSRVRISLQVLPDRTCEGEGEVVRQARDLGFGCEFDELNAELVEFIDDIGRLRDALQGDFLRSVVGPTLTVQNLG